jgi:hypothetical protein
LYSYQIINEDGSPGEVIELMRHINDPPLTRHPETGAPIRRLISTPSIAGRHTDRAVKNMLNDNKRLGELGFTKYERTGKGVMERKAGTKGPRIISAD